MDPSVKALIEAMTAANEQMAKQQAATEERAAKQQEQITALMTQLAAPQQLALAAPRNSLHKDLSDRIKDFVYNADENLTFDLWYGRYETIFTVEAAGMTDPQKLDLITEKLSTTDYQKFANTILPATKLNITFASAITHLKRLFGKKESQFALRYKCLKIKREPGEDWATYGARINLKGEKFDIEHCTAEDLKVLLFIQGLQAPEDKQTLEKLLSKLDEQEKKREEAESRAVAVVAVGNGEQAAPIPIAGLKLQDVINYAERLSNLKTESTMVSNPAAVVEVNAIQRKPWPNRRNDSRSSAGSSFSSAPFRQGSGYAASSVSGYSTASTVPPTQWRQPTAQPTRWQQPQRRQGPQPSRPCSFCGDMHWQANCPFNEKFCAGCKTKGHKPGFCQQAAEERERMARNAARLNSEQRRSLQTINSDNNIAKNRRFITPEFNNGNIKLQLDTGSDWTMISAENHKRIGAPALTYVAEKALDANREPLKILGKFKASVTINGNTYSGWCYVAERDDLNLFGNDWMADFGLNKIPIDSFCSHIICAKAETQRDSEIQARFPELFKESLGLCNTMQASLTLKEGTKPIFRRARSVPFASQEPIEAELKRLQLLGVITPVDYSDFAAPIVVVKKPNGKIRICADYSTGLNEALEPHQYPLPTTEDIHAKLGEFKVFSKIDMSDAFLQIELNDNAKKLLTINTHVGLFQVNRLQPGIKTAPGQFQQNIDSTMSGAKGVFTYLDDSIIGGRNRKEHDENLNEALRRLQAAGFHLRIEKCEFNRDSLTFLGLQIDKNGSRPDPEKIKALQNIPAPTDVQQLQAFLGAVTWYGKFIPDMKKYRGPLDELLCKDVKFEWQPKHQQAFLELKEMLKSDLALTHFDPTKPLIVAADASSYGIGAVLMHQMPDGSERPILHATTSLSSAEKKYSQIDREALGLTFAVKKFHRYIFGRKFELRTDHKPLLSIFGSKNGIPAFTANRLQRFALTLLNYDFDIKYINTESFAYADFISRLISKHDRPEEDIIIASIRQADNLSCFAIETAKSLPVNFDAIQEETAKDETLRKVLQCCTNGWPQNTKGMEPEVAAFFGRRNDYTIQQDCIFFAHRVIIPSRFRQRILDDLHEGHQGIERTKMLARSKVYWPSIDNDIENKVRGCEICATNAKTPRKTLLQAWPIPKSPWSRIHIDFAGPINGYSFLVIVDALSNWPEIRKMTTTTTAKTIEQLEDVFASQGWPDTIVSDNGPQLVSSDFENFCKGKGIEHITSAPFHPQSNGRAERFVDLLKTGLKKFEGEGNVDRALRKFLFCYRYTPSHALGDKSPFEIMTGRIMKTKLDLLKPSDNSKRDRNTKMEQQFNRHHGATTKEFKLGEEIYIQIHSSNNKWTWQPGVIIGRLGSVDYSVYLCSNGRKIQAHTNKLKKRFNEVDTDGNELIDHFELELPSTTINLQPELIPEDNDEQEDEDDFESAQDDTQSEEDEPALPRRSGRANIGQPPQRYSP